jgi:hypothetical protein
MHSAPPGPRVHSLHCVHPSAPRFRTLVHALPYIWHTWICCPAGYEQFILGGEIAMVAIFVEQARLCNVNDQVQHWAAGGDVTAAQSLNASPRASIATAPPART